MLWPRNPSRNLGISDSLVSCLAEEVDMLFSFMLRAPKAPGIPAHLRTFWDHEALFFWDHEEKKRSVGKVTKVTNLPGPMWGGVA